MPYTFTFRDMERICRALGMSPAQKGSRFWRGVGPDGVFRQTAAHPHRSGGTVASGSAKVIATQLGFASVEAVYEFLKKL